MCYICVPPVFCLRAFKPSAPVVSHLALGAHHEGGHARGLDLHRLLVSQLLAPGEPVEAMANFGFFVG